MWEKRWGGERCVRASWCRRCLPPAGASGARLRCGRMMPAPQELCAVERSCLSRFSIFLCGCKQPKSVHILMLLQSYAYFLMRQTISMKFNIRARFSIAERGLRKRNVVFDAGPSTGAAGELQTGGRRTGKRRHLHTNQDASEHATEYRDVHAKGNIQTLNGVDIHTQRTTDTDTTKSPGRAFSAGACCYADAEASVSALVITSPVPCSSSLCRR